MSDQERYDSLEGQCVLVTGATRGIGEYVATQLTSMGETVYAGARSTADITATDQHPIELDVTDDETIERTLERIEQEAGRLDALVNDAGIAGPIEPLHENETADVDATLAVNLRGPVILTKRALPLLLERPGGLVVNVSSGMSGTYPAYRIAKAGLNALTTHLHGEYSHRGLIANAACPGWVRTDLGSPNAPKNAVEGADTPVWLTTFRPGSTAGRFWRDREIIDW